jgi:hypothetical protein
MGMEILIPLSSDYTKKDKNLNLFDPTEPIRPNRFLDDIESHGLYGVTVR